MVEVIRAGAPLAILALAVAGFVAIGEPETPPRSDSADQAIPLVETVTVEPDPEGLVIDVDGTVVPFREVTVAAEVAGKIALKSDVCKGGRYVTKGTLLMEIDPRDYQLEVERLSEELAQADVAIQELEVEKENTQALMKLAEQDVRLTQNELARLAKLPANYTSDTELDQARRAVLNAQNTIQTLKNQERLLETRAQRAQKARNLVRAQLDKARLDLERTRVMAPFDGMVVRDSAEQDSFVQKGAELFVLEDTSRAEVKCNLTMEDLHWLWRSRGPAAAESTLPVDGYQLPPTPVSVVYELAGRSYRWEGELSRYDGIGVDARTRTVPCRVVVLDPRQVHLERGGPNPTPGDLPAGATSRAADSGAPPALVRGMFVTVRVRFDPGVGLIKVPDHAVQPGNKVWKLAGGKVQIAEVEVARAMTDYVLVRADASRLAAGDKVIVSPLASAVDGLVVRERQPQRAEAADMPVSR